MEYINRGEIGVCVQEEGTLVITAPGQYCDVRRSGAKQNKSGILKACVDEKGDCFQWIFRLTEYADISMIRPELSFAVGDETSYDVHRCWRDANLEGMGVVFSNTETGAQFTFHKTETE